jgi:transketolase
MQQFFPKEWLENYGQNGSLLGQHPTIHGVRGIDAATGRCENIMSLHPFIDKWRAFGWHTLEINGHDFRELRKLSEHSDAPLAVIAHAIKGKGVSFMENDNNWHYKLPTEQQVILANKELGFL